MAWAIHHSGTAPVRSLERIDEGLRFCRLRPAIRSEVGNPETRRIGPSVTNALPLFPAGLDQAPAGQANDPLSSDAPLGVARHALNPISGTRLAGRDPLDPGIPDVGRFGRICIRDTGTQDPSTGWTNFSV
jgi:hypothetical protein